MSRPSMWDRILDTLDKMQRATGPTPMPGPSQYFRAFPMAVMLEPGVVARLPVWTITSLN